MSLSSSWSKCGCCPLLRGRERAQRLLVLRDRTHLDAAEARAGNSRGDLDRLIQVLRFDEVIAAELFLGFNERPVGGGNLSVADSDRRRRSGRLQPVARDVVAAFANRVGELG